MSDERDVADAADGDATDEEHRGRTAVVTRPQRPTGKRSRQGAEADDSAGDSSSGAVELTESDADDGPGKKAKKAKKASKSGEPSSNPVVFVYTYLKQVIAELRKVIWPNRKQMSSYTSVVLVFLIFMVTFIGLVDLGLAKLVLLVFG